MSAASTPPPRTKSRSGSSSSSSRPAGRRQSFFLPIFIYLLGAGALAGYHVMAISDQLDQLTLTVDRLDSKVKRAQYEKTKFFHIAADVLRLAPHDPNAETVAMRFRLHKLQVAEPELFDTGASPEIDLMGASGSSTSGLTNLAPIHLGPGLSPAPSASPASAPAGTGSK